MSNTFYPTIEEALYLHNLLIQEFGGSPGTIDRGLLESALARPKSGYYSSLSEQAAALLQSLAMNHCFVDGNKRVAFGLTAVFLRVNGYRLQVSTSQGLSFMEKDLIHRKIPLDMITAWIEKRMIAI